MSKTTIAAVATASALALAGIATGAAAASGAWISKPTAAYTSPSDKSIPVAFLSPGDAVQPVCFTEGQQLRQSSLWFRIAKDGISGYVHRDTIGGISGDVRHC
jgi:hypothetical protein